MATVANEGASLGLDFYLNLLLVVIGSLQLGALVTQVAGRKRVALAMAGTNAAITVALCIVVLVGFLRNHGRFELLPTVFVVLNVAAATAAAIGLAMRRESDWLFWPVWLWNFVLLYLLVQLRFFFHLTF